MNLIIVGEFNKNLTCYANGIKTNSISYTKGEIQGFGTREFVIGGAVEYFKGTIDEISIYGKALTNNEVKALYNAKKAKFYEQLLGKGIKEIDISNCNLEKGQYYTVVGFTDKTKVEQVMMAK